jgi:hypothetical protein
VVNKAERGRNRTKSEIRSRIEHVIGVIKLKFGFAEVRHRGLEKNANRLLRLARWQIGKFFDTVPSRTGYVSPNSGGNGKSPKTRKTQTTSPPKNPSYATNHAMRGFLRSLESNCLFAKRQLCCSLFSLRELEWKPESAVL